MTGGQVMIVMIVLIGVIGGIMKARFRTHHHGASGATDQETARLRDEVRQMKERIHVLERVITDNHKSVDLDREIERLRDR